MERKISAATAALLSALALIPKAVMAGGLTLMPVRLELSDDRRVGSFTVRNDAGASVAIDVQAAAWTQSEGLDQHAPTRDIIVTPSVFSLAPGASQVVRFGLRRPPDAVRELAYRVFVTELPPPAQPDRPGVAMTLRLSVPLFLRPGAASKPDLRWRLAREGGALRLTARNEGSAHAQVANLALHDGARVVAKQPDPAYLLPGQERSWRIATAGGTTPGRGMLNLQGYSDAGPLDVELQLE